MEKNHLYDILGRRRPPVSRAIQGELSGDEGVPGVSSHRGVDLPEALLTVRDLAVLLAASESAVYARHARGGIPGGIRLGRTFASTPASSHNGSRRTERAQEVSDDQAAPLEGSKNEFEADTIVTGPNGRTRRKRVKVSVTGRSHAERWARVLEQELLVQLLTPGPEVDKPPPPAFEDLAQNFLDLCRANRLGVNTLMNYDVYLRCYLVPVLGKRRLDQVRPADVGLHWSDLDLARGRMTIRHNIVRGRLDLPKGRTEDDVALTQRLTEALTRLPVEGPLVFTRDAGGHFPEHQVVRWLKHVVKQARVSWHGTHVLRKTCGTRIADGGGRVAAVATRHKDLQTASRYIDRRVVSSRAIAAPESGWRRGYAHPQVSVATA